MASIFTQIINGDIPSHKLYEDEHSFVILDIHPLREGHTLVLSKREVARYEDLTEDEFAALMRTVHKVAQKQQEVFHPKRVFQMAHSYGVDHVHIHVMPTNEYSDIKNAILKHETIDVSAEPDHEALAQVAKKLKM